MRVLVKKSKRPLRIVFLALGWPPAHPAGSEVMGHTLAKALVGAGHDVTVSLSRPDWAREPYELDGVQVLPHVGSNQDTRRTALADVVIGHLADAGRAIVLAKKNRARSIVIVHNEQPFPSAGADLVVLNSEHLARRFAGQLEHQRTLVVRPHVAGEDYATKPGAMVTLVNANPDKGGALIDPLAQALPELEFLVVEGAYGEQVKPTAVNTEWLELQDPRHMRQAVYARTRVLLAPSSTESWGRVAVEAMTSGIPVVAHPTAGLLESLGDAGIFADRADPAQWVDALTRLRNSRTWNAASRKAKARAQEVEAMTRADIDAFVETVSAMPRRIR